MRQKINRMIWWATFSIVMVFVGLVRDARAEAPRVYGSDGRYLGNLSANRYDPDSINNPYGRHGSRYAEDGVNNPFSQFGSQYSDDSANNPYASGGGDSGAIGSTLGSGGIGSTFGR